MVLHLDTLIFDLFIIGMCLLLVVVFFTSIIMYGVNKNADTK